MQTVEAKSLISEYCKKGLHLIPLRNGEKLPALSGWQKKATSDIGQIGAWVNQYRTKNIGLATGPESGVFVLDIDVKGKAGGLESMKTLIEKHGKLPDTPVATTPTGGYHYFFKYPNGMEVRNSASQIGGGLDIRGEGGFVVIAPSRVEKGAYQWLEGKSILDIPVATAPRWLLQLIKKEKKKNQVATPSTSNHTSKVKEGEGRNQLLTSFAGVLRNKGVDENAMLTMLKAYNEAQFDPPLDDAEVLNVWKSVQRYDKGAATLNWWEENPNGTMTLKHDVLGEYVIEKRMIVRYPDAHGDLYYYDEASGLYELDKTCRKIRSFIRGEDDLKRNQVREVLEYIEDMSPIKSEISKEYVGVGNGLLRLSDMSFEPFTPDVFITSKIPTGYNPDAYDDFVADTLFKVSCGHAATIQNLTEMFGSVLHPNVLVPKVFYLYGRSASNGKSSVLFMIQETFGGSKNISSVSPQKLATNTFAAASMYGKMANVVDDLPDVQIVDSGIFKSVVTGGYVEIEGKNKASFADRIFATQIIASNFYPNFKENGAQINKRLHIIPFDHNFAKDDTALPEMETMARFETQKAKEYVLKLAVDAVKSMSERKEALTYNEKAEAAKVDFAESNDPLSDFFSEYDKAFFEEAHGKEAVRAYVDWCSDNYVSHPLGTKRYKEAVCAHYDMEWKVKQLKINGQWKSVKGFKSVIKNGNNGNER